MKLIYITLGTIALTLGTIGIVVPVLPTTPFYLLSLFCFERGSNAFHQMFVNSNLYKKHLAEFVESRTMTLKSKFKILTFATTMITLSFIAVSSIHVRIFLIVLTAFMYYYFFAKIKTVKKDKE